MSKSISHKVFRCLLLLYPKLFLDEFGKEMLDVYEQCEHWQSSWRLLADVILSAIKQQMYYRSILAPGPAPACP